MNNNKVPTWLIIVLVAIIVLLIGVILLLLLKDDKDDDNVTRLPDNSSVQINNKENSNSEANNESNDNQTSNTKNEKDYISQDKAIDIALKDANYSRADVFDLEVELDYKYGTNVYEISFYYDKYDYEYYINAENGNIVHSFKEVDR